MNQTIITGNLGRDPELNYTPSGKAVCKFSLAESTGKDQTTWWDIVCWDKTAEYANTYLHKGNKVLVSGRVTKRDYTGKDGSKRLAVEIVATNIENMTPKAQAAAGTGDDPLADLDHEHPF